MKNIRSPQDVKQLLLCESEVGERLNAMFMSWAMNDGEAIRIIVHRDFGIKEEILEAFHTYYKNHDKGKLFEKINELDDDASGTSLFYISSMINPDYDYEQPDAHEYEIMSDIDILQLKTNNSTFCSITFISQRNQMKPFIIKQ